MKNFEDYYGASQKIIITKNYLEKDDNVFYIPAFLFAFIDL
jgi:hypothetical protein